MVGFCRGEPDKMMGIVKKVEVQGFGIIEGADGFKVPFILSDVLSHQLLKPGQKVAFSVRRVKNKAFAQYVAVLGRATHLV
jgi:cold shock CspA family protein